MGHGDIEQEQERDWIKVDLHIHTLDDPKDHLDYSAHQLLERAQELGFSLSEIRELLSIQIDPKKECSDVQRLAEAKIADIKAKIRTLQSMQRVLGNLAKACPGCGPSSECPILESIDAAGVHA